MGKTNPKKTRTHKYANKAPQIFENGFAVTLGGADEIAHHYRRHFQLFLEKLTVDPSAQNPLDQVGGLGCALEREQVAEQPVRLHVDLWHALQPIRPHVAKQEAFDVEGGQDSQRQRTPMRVYCHAATLASRPITHSDPRFRCRFCSSVALSGPSVPGGSA